MSSMTVGMVRDLLAQYPDEMFVCCVAYDERRDTYDRYEAQRLELEIDELIGRQVLVIS